MKYEVTQPFIAFGKTPQPGELVDLTDEQAKILLDMGSVKPYEVKVKSKPENKSKGKKSASSRAGRARTKKTPKRSRKSVSK